MAANGAALVMIVARTEAAEYFGQQYGVTASDEAAALSLIKRDLEASGPFTFVSVYEVRLADFAGKDSSLHDKQAASGHAGIWHRSGRCWFDEGEEDVLDDLL